MVPSSEQADDPTWILLLGMTAILSKTGYSVKNRLCASIHKLPKKAMEGLGRPKGPVRPIMGYATVTGLRSGYSGFQIKRQMDIKNGLYVPCL